jgi:hypothetical protein
MTNPKNPRLRKGELFRALGYQPHPGQALVHASASRRRVMACGTRFGKSTVGIHEVIAALLAPATQSLGWLVAPNYDLTSRIFKRVVELLEARMPHRIVAFHAREHRLLVANLGGGVSEVRAKSADSSVSLLGESLDWLVVDEAARIKAELWQQSLAPRLLERRGWSLLLSTPQARDWFHGEYRRGQRGRDPEYESWALPTAMNPHVPREAIEAERKRLSAEVFAQMYEAQFPGVDLDPCDRCHGPTYRIVPGVLDLRDDERERSCLDCKRLVDARGESAVWHDGEKLWPTLIFHLQSAEYLKGAYRGPPLKRAGVA